MRVMQHRELAHRFVRHVPERLDPGVLYVSVEFGTAAHRCCCGCGEEVVTPLTPTDWRMTFDGETVSLWPSVGNWNSACRSHYVIDRGRVITAGAWSDAQVAAERQRDRAAKARHYGAVRPAIPPAPQPPAAAAPRATPAAPAAPGTAGPRVAGGAWRALRHWVLRRLRGG